jgi:hypothetical protein
MLMRNGPLRRQTGFEVAVMQWHFPRTRPRAHAVACLKGPIPTAGLILTLVVASAIAGCASSSDYVYKLYGGALRPDAEVATIRLADAAAARVDDRNVSQANYGSVKVLPGAHHLAWECVYGVSVMIEPTGFATGQGSAGIELQAGHEYALRCDRTTGPGYETYQWIVDESVGRLVAGEKKP